LMPMLGYYRNNAQNGCSLLLPRILKLIKKMIHIYRDEF
jgi:hypothetical protein